MSTSLLRELEERWHSEIPISATMGIRVRHFDGTRLDVVAALTPNRNVHGTAFAGSLFSAAALCGWGQVYLQLRAAGVDGSIVFVEGRIRCLAPVHDDMVASCVWTDAAGTALANLRQTGRTRIHLEVQVECEGVLGADFHGEYAVRTA